MIDFRTICLSTTLLLLSFIAIDTNAQSCFPGLTVIDSEDFNNCGVTPTDWQLLQTGTGGLRWGINHDGVVNDPPSSNCWARFNDNGFSRTGTLRSPSYDVSAYQSLSLSFYAELDNDWEVEKVSLIIYHSNGSALYWNGTEWVENPAVWLRGVNNTDDDYLEDFSELIPTSFIAGNTGFYVDWFFDDNDSNAKEFSVDNFSLCGNQTCGFSLGDITIQNAETCDGTGTLEVEMIIPGTPPYEVTLGGNSYAFTRTATVFTIPNIPIGRYTDFIIKDDNDCRLVGPAFRIDGPLIFFEDFDDCTMPSSGMTFTNTGGGPGWDFENEIIYTTTFSGIPQGSCWAVYRENESGSARTATAKSPVIDATVYSNIDLSFFYGFDRRNGNESLSLSIHNLGDGSALWWDGTAWGSQTAWLSGGDFTGFFSNAIPTNFMTGNTQLQVQWYYDDGGDPGRGFAIDNFSLCGEIACAVNAGAPIPTNAPTCIGNGFVEIPLNSPTGTTFTASVNGGTPEPVTFNGTSIFVLDLPIGTHDILVADSDNGCDQLLEDITIEGPEFTITATKVNPTCDLSNGSISSSVTTGPGNYSYLWSNNATSPTISNLAPGMYSVTITDTQRDCISTTSRNLTNEGAPLNVTFDNILAPTACGQDGTATANHTPAGANVSYEWDNGETSPIATGLSAGTHAITVTNNADNQACPVIETVNIPTGPASLSLSSPTITPVSCRGGTDGAITGIMVSNGNPPYEFEWEKGNGTPIGTTIDISGLSAGNYILYVTDDDGCLVTVAHTITQPAAFEATFDNVNVDCNGAATGAIDVTISGGTAPYSYFWGPNYGTTEDLTELTAGTYVLTVTDDNDCIFETQTTITDNPQLTIDQINLEESVSCFGGSDGEATVSAIGGVTGYTYLWDNGETDETATALTGGLHQVTVTDALGCSTEETINIGQPLQITATANVNPATCLGSSDGSATLNALGGTPNYYYLWPDGQTSETVNNLDAGTYIVTITDDNNCLGTTSVTVGEEAPISLADTQIDVVSCFGDSDGQVVVNPSQGAGGYTFLWEDGTNVNTISNVPAGAYSLTVTDVGNCRAEQTFNIGEPDELILSTNAPDSICGATLVSVSASTTGGNSSFDFSWSDGAATATTDVTINESHTVSVVDDKGCNAEVTFTIIGAAQPGLVDVDSIAIDIISGQGISINLDEYFDLDAGYDWTISNQEAVTLSPATTSGTITDLFEQNMSLTSGNSFGEVIYTFSSFIDEEIRCDGAVFKVKVSVLQSDGNTILVPNIIIKGSEWGIQLLDDSDRMSYKVSVHNRSGAKVFDKILGEEEWDGGGLQDGVYYYIITDDKGNKVKTGAVLLQK